MGGSSVNKKKKNPANISMDHVLIALGETNEESDVRIRSLFNFFDAGNNGYLDYGQIETGLSALQIPPQYKYARELFKVCDANCDAIDVAHNGSILPEELWDALDKAEKEKEKKTIEGLAAMAARIDSDTIIDSEICII